MHQFVSKRYKIERMNVKDLTLGQQKTITGCTCETINGKLLCMGVKPGCKVTLLRKTNFDKTFYIKVNESRMAIRADEASKIEIS